MGFDFSFLHEKSRKQWNRYGIWSGSSWQRNGHQKWNATREEQKIFSLSKVNKI
jgi:hypothetical protein